MNSIVFFRNAVLSNPALCIVLLTIAMSASHCIGDWFIQTQYQAINKPLGKWLNRALLTHCTNYTLCYVPTFLFFEINLCWLVFIFGGHLFIDRRSPVIWLRKYVTRNSDENISATFWITIVMDQILHMLFNVIVIFAKAYEMSIPSTVSIVVHRDLYMLP